VSVTGHRLNLALLDDSQTITPSGNQSCGLNSDNVTCIQALPCTADYVTHEGMLELAGTLECEQPNEHLYDFVGTFALANQLRCAIGKLFL